MRPEDPRKKVAIKIENFRRDFPLDSPDFPGHFQEGVAFIRDNRLLGAVASSP